MQLPGDIFDRRPEEGARRVALGFLDEAVAGAARLDDEDDAEALHDFRVAIRRLRSTLRAYQAVLGASVKKKERRALKGLQEATGGGRDAEVFLEWLSSRRARLSPSHQVGAAWLEKRLDARKRAAMASIRGEVASDFAKIERRLRARLATMEIAVRLDGRDAGPRPTFGDALATLVRDHAEDLRDLGRSVTGADDQERAHRTRIAGKRFRYLLEPFAGHDEGVEELVKRVKKLQSLLGDLHDVHVFGEALGDAVGEAAAEQARRLHAILLREADGRASLARERRRNERPGLLALTRLARTEADELFARFRADWLEGGLDALVADAEALAARVARRRPDGVEIERKYLLRALPEEARGAPAVEIEQGYLPGDRLRERLRRTRDADGATTHLRTIKLGVGIERTEVEEPVDAALFERLWPLTEGCRVRKRRYRVEVDGHVFEVDEFLDRELVLAEVELDHAAEEVTLPDWLEAVLDREVTDDPDYVNLRLAR